MKLSLIIGLNDGELHTKLQKVTKQRGLNIYAVAEREDDCSVSTSSKLERSPVERKRVNRDDINRCG